MMGRKSEKTWFEPCFVFIAWGDLGVLKVNSNAKIGILVNCQLIVVTFPGGNSPRWVVFLQGFFPKFTSIQVAEVLFYPRLCCHVVSICYMDI